MKLDTNIPISSVSYNGVDVELAGGVYTWNKYSTELADGYTAVEYIESTGTQYIDTGFAVSSSNLTNLRFEIDQVIISGTHASASGVGNTAPFFYIGTIGGTIYYGNGAADTSTGVTYDYTRRTFVVDAQNGKVEVTGLVDMSATFNSTAGSRILYLFGYNDGSRANMHSAKVYGCKIYENGTLKRDFVPCTNAGGTAGLYDKANSVFYPNAGTGNFVASTTLAKGALIGQVNSADVNAYPFDGMQDVYYYEAVGETINISENGIHDVRAYAVANVQSAPVLLWTNASPTSDFVAQTVTLPTGYSGYIVELRVTTSTVGVLNRTFVPNNGGALCAVSYYAESSGNVGAVRNAIGKASAIEFSYGKSANSNTQRDGEAIPTRIWGVKFTL